MRKRNLLVVALLAATFSAQAAWQAGEWQSEPSTTAGLEHRQTSAENPETGARATVHLALFPAKNFKLRVIDAPDVNNPDLAAAMEGEKTLAGVNGGYFTPEFTPIGLRVRDGKTTAILQRAKLLTGILLSSPNGVQIIRPLDFSKTAKVDAAVQAGPNLVDAAKPVKGLNDTRAARRTFALTTTGGRAALGYSSSVTLAELGDILATIAIDPSTKVQRAINLDGGSSSAFWFRRADGSAFSIREQKSVRDFVAIVPR